MASFNQEPLGQAPVAFSLSQFVAIGSNAGSAQIVFKPQRANFAQLPPGQPLATFSAVLSLSSTASVATAVTESSVSRFGFSGATGQKVGISEATITYPSWRKKAKEFSTGIRR